MEFINAETFKNQPKEVQEVFLKWRKPSIGDLVSINVCTINGKDEDMIFAINDDSNEINKLKDIPLFTEGKLKKFIEDKTGCRINEIIYREGTGYDVILEYFDGLYEDLGNDLFQVYWNIALQIAKESITNDNN
ncbi:MAG: hypothetical protein LIR50_05915 [Bacillota bacterium]|nr:hypothetical protein [Bacillota bacterium]